MLQSSITLRQKALLCQGGKHRNYVADSGVYSESNMRQLNEAGVKWVSRVPETSKEAKAVLQEGSEQWQTAEDGSM